MRTIVALCLIFLLTSCKSSQVSQSDDQLRQLVTILAKENLSSADIDYVSSNYSKTISKLQGEAEKVLRENTRFKWKSALGIYQDLNVLAISANKHPELMLSAADYSSKISELKIEAAEDIYQEALSALSANSRQSAKAAYFQFQEVDQLVQGYKQVTALKNEALSSGTTQVMLSFISVDSLLLKSTFHEIERLLYTKGIAGPFVIFIPFDIENDTPRKHLASIHFDQILTSEQSVNHYTQEVEQTSQKEDFKIREVTVNISSTLTVEITELELNQVLLTKPLLIQSSITHLSGEFDGDKKLLNEYQRKLLETESESITDTEILSSLHTPIKNQVTKILLDFYQSY